MGNRVPTLNGEFLMEIRQIPGMQSPKALPLGGDSVLLMDQKMATITCSREQDE